jgi:hypothetical protein
MLNLHLLIISWINLWPLSIFSMAWMGVDMRTSQPALGLKVPSQQLPVVTEEKSVRMTGIWNGS